MQTRDGNNHAIREAGGVVIYDSDRILSIDWFKKSLSDARSASVKHIAMAS